MAFSIVVGCRVSARIGPFEGAALATTTTTGEHPGTKAKRPRRNRSLYHGTVVQSTSEKNWRVHWDECNKTSDHKSTNLKFLAARSNDFDPSLLDTWLNAAGMYVGGHNVMLNWTQDLSGRIPRYLDLLRLYLLCLYLLRL